MTATRDDEAGGRAYQPKTGQPCGCKRGVQRDNCPNCEGTGLAIDFAAIRARRPAPPAEPRIVAECVTCVECRCEAYGKADHFCTDLVPAPYDDECRAAGHDVRPVSR